METRNRGEWHIAPWIAGAGLLWLFLKTSTITHPSSFQDTTTNLCTLFWHSQLLTYDWDYTYKKNMHSSTQRPWAHQSWCGWEGECQLIYTLSHLWSLCTSVTHCQLTISLANSRYITWLLVVVYIYFLYIFAHRKPGNLKYIFDTWTLKCHTKIIMSVSHLQIIFCQWNAVRIYFWWVDPEMSLSHLRDIFLC